jgi:transcription antitermination factor NusG
MALDSPPLPSGFQPGDKVRIINGTFISMTGTVLASKDVEDRGYSVGPGEVFVLLVIFGQEIPISLAPWQLELA